MQRPRQPWLVVLMLALLPRIALAQPAQDPNTNTANDGRVTFGVISFLQYGYELHERDGYNAFEVTRGYLDVTGRLSDRMKVRFTTNVRPTTDASLDANLTARLEYAYLEAAWTPERTFMFGMQPTPWLTFEESIDRYRVQGPMFAEREGLIPGPSDLGAGLRYAKSSFEVHAGVYNGEGYGRAELDKYKSVQGRGTITVFSSDASRARLSGFYTYGWYARDRPRNVGIFMASYQSPHLAATAQYLSATDNPFVVTDIERQGMSFFGEGRMGETGWAGFGRVDMFNPDADREGDDMRRYIFGGAHWSQLSHGRIGFVASLEQVFRVSSGQKTESRLLVQTQVEF
ncbi:MAG TPA: hypothetical protein VFZ31_12800 [Vicinamibacterales bacterium]